MTLRPNLPYPILDGSLNTTYLIENDSAMQRSVDDGKHDINVANITANGDILATGDISSVPWTDYSSISTIVGWSSYTEKQIWYKKTGKTVFVTFNLNGTSNNNNTTFTLPFTSAASVYTYLVLMGKDNGTWLTSRTMQLNPLGVTAQFFTNATGGNWTATNGKAVLGQFRYETG